MGRRMMEFAVVASEVDVEDAAERSCLVSSTTIGVSSSSSSSSPSSLRNGGARFSRHYGISVLGRTGTGNN